ncbi:hypothetical protein BDU57DRAFT_539337 [Ampelomyces quisqualis]|uniref:Uncharacterized protein n=1 Tax=Ampelomyces quisqualis TaxID=50730 RepID=A0A6A5QQP9_AMPQU|nr:hypothetical protein BDU57DRAFT_539337 [Ampelomyces quisqualis]
MSASHRTDSLIIPIFPRRLSELVTPMASISEQPKTLIHARTIASPELTASGHPYTFLDSSSSGGSSPSGSPSASKPAYSLFPRQQTPSFPSLHDLGYEYEYEENDDDEGEEWSKGWNISSSGTTGQASRDLRPLYQPELPEIQEDTFAYYPEPGMSSSSDKGHENLRIARRRLARNRSGKNEKPRLTAWLKKALGKLRSRGRR